MAPLPPSDAIADVHAERMIYSVGMLSGRLVKGFGLRAALLALVLLVLRGGTVAWSFPVISSTENMENVDSILILKKDRGLAPKQREGDARTPEGHYLIDAKYEHSKYHKALHVSYPNAEDRKRGCPAGCVARRSDHDSRTPEWEGLGGSAASSFRLDTGVHRRYG
jgi:hypothetical protein